jgi:TetR/AcrR family transcriptional regulator, transcriptional repressor for nem operon
MAGGRGQQTRDDILRAGARLFALHGYYHTSMKEILEAVSLSKGAFYHHFKSKEDFARAVVAQMRAEYEQVMQASAEAAAGQRFGMMLDRFVELNESGQWYNGLLLARLIQESHQGEGDLSEEVLELVRWLRDDWRQMLVEGQSAGMVREELEAEVCAEMLVSVWLGAIPCRELEDGFVHLSRIAGQIKNLIMKQPG